MRRTLLLTLLFAAVSFLPLAQTFQPLTETTPETDDESLLSLNESGENSRMTIGGGNPLGWEWVQKDSDAGYTWVRAVKGEATGGMYVAGIFRGGSISLDQHHALNNGGLDVFVAHLDSSGDWSWMTTLGGVLDEYVEAMELDSSGDLVIVGSFDSPSFNTSTTQLTNQGSRDAFAVKVDGSTGAIVWGASIGGSGFDNLTGVTELSTGNLGYSGWTTSPSLTINGTQHNNSGDSDILIVWSTNSGIWDHSAMYGGSGKEQSHDVAADQNGRLMVVGEFASSTLSLDQTTVSHGGGIGSDSLVMRVARSGVEWVRKPICAINDRAWTVDVDSAGNVFVGGEVFHNSTSTANNYRELTWGSIQITQGRDWNTVYVVKFSNVGAIGWAIRTYNSNSYAGSNYWQQNPSISVDGTTIGLGFDSTYRFRFKYGSGSSSDFYTQNNYGINANFIHISSTGSALTNNYITSRDTSIDDIDFIDQSSGSDTGFAAWNLMSRSVGNSQTTYFGEYMDSPHATVRSYQWSSGPQTLLLNRPIGATYSESILDYEPLNSTHSVMLIHSRSQSMRFGDSVVGGNVSHRVLLVTIDENGSWESVDQIIMSDMDAAAMSVSPNGTVWVVVDRSGWADVSGLVSWPSGSGLIIASWTASVGWVSADIMWGMYPEYDNEKIFIASDLNGDVFIGGLCSSTVTVTGQSFTGSSQSAPCIAMRNSTSGWTHLERAGYNYDYAIDAMTDHDAGGVYMWTRSGYWSRPTGSTHQVYDYSAGALVEFLSSNQSSWLVSYPTCTNSNCNYAQSLDVTSSGDVLLGGHFSNSISFPSCCSVNSGGSWDGYIARWNGTVKVWDWSISLGGTGSDYLLDVRDVGNGSIAAVGEKSGVISVGLTTLSSGGTGFVAMASEQGTWSWAAQPSNSTVIQQVIPTSNDTIHVAGVLSRDNRLRTFGLDSLSSADGEDIFISRMSADNDADGITNNRDNCVSIYNPPQADYDADSQGDICDSDDDADGISDLTDTCPMGDTGWVSNVTIDHDSDGCLDASEDTDDDDDGRPDSLDSCPSGQLAWLSNSTSDHDNDGCHDGTEDLDDDDDMVADLVDACPLGSLGWISDSSTDHDADGCYDSGEDLDDDDDSVTDPSDACPRGELNWSSTAATDNDGDGCRDAGEDDNDDDDDFLDHEDFCPAGSLNWHSGAVTDYDGDGCLDANEDTDDDADGVLDVDDNCVRSPLGWRTNPTIDFDGDGCHDLNEDADDDGDGINDLDDLCSRTPAGTAADSAGCAPGEVRDGVAGGSNGGNVTVINQYNNTTWVNHTWVNSSWDNQSFTNESWENYSYNWDNTTWENETFLNSTTNQHNTTNLNQTINEGDELNGTDNNPLKQEEAESGSLMENQWMILIAGLVVFGVVLLVMGQLRGSSRRDEDGSPYGKHLGVYDEELVSLDGESTTSAFDEVTSSHAAIQSDTPAPTTPSFNLPPTTATGVPDGEGYEWFEWPAGSGVNYYRPVESGDDWAVWDS